MSALDDVALRLVEAQRRGELLDAPPASLSLDEAYHVQGASLRLREADGERLIGWKMGFTSKAKMVQMNVHAPIYGYLTDRMLMTDGATLQRSRLRQPRVEPEICFVMAHDVVGPVTPAQALAATRGVCAALEVLDSRYRDFKFDLPSVVADNTSAAFVVLGSALASVDDIGNLGIVLECDGKVVETASSAAVFEHPARALAELINRIAPRPLKAGHIIMSGGATAAVSLSEVSGVRATVERIGSVSLRVD